MDPIDLDALRRAHHHGRMETVVKALEGLPVEQWTLHGQVLLGCALFQSGKVEQGRNLLDEALGRVADQEPEPSAWAADLGLACLLTGDTDRARRFLRRAVALLGPDAAAHTRLGVALLAGGEDEAARESFSQAVQRDPDRPEVQANLGAVLMRLGRLDEALAHYDRALRLRPDLPQAQAGRSALLVALERSDEAVLELERRLEQDIDLAESIALRRHLAFVLDAAGRLDEAVATLRQAAVLDPEDLAVRLQLAGLLLSLEQPGPALAELDKAAGVEPENLHVLAMTARARSEAGDHGGALETAGRAVVLHPDSPFRLIIRGEARAAADDFAGAVEDLEAACAELPGAAQAWAGLGHVHLLGGDLERCVDCFRRAAEINPQALAALVEARAYPEDRETVERMVRLADNPMPHREPRASMSFALSRLFEKRGEYDRAFRYADQANRLVDMALDWDPDHWTAVVDRLARTFTPELFARLRWAGSSSERPVFVCGMPRSGTSLTEQILSSHPDVHGAGELGYAQMVTVLLPRALGGGEPYPDCMRRFTAGTAEQAAGYYLARVARMDKGAARVVDKMPHNFLHLGLLALLFPRARFVHVWRDPRDVAVSGYFTNFKHRRGALGYAFNLAHTGRMLLDHRRIMRHWAEVLPAPVFHLRYEDLVDRPEDTARKLLEFVGLAWDERVMAFHRTERAVKTASAWQVRQPMYTSSVARWKRYEAHLGPLLEVLEQGGVELEG